MSMPRSSRLAALATLTVVSVGAGVLAVPATAAAAVPAAAAAAANAQAVAPKGGTATAASPILVSGQAGWGFKASWNSYVANNGGTVTVAGGATKGAGDVVAYPVVHGAVNPAGLDADVRFGGSVTYSVPTHDITAITLANPRVVLKDGTGTLFVDVTTNLVGSTPATTKAVPFATLKASASALSGSKLDWKGITATITAKGGESFAFQGRPMYPAGTALDNLALGGTVSVPTLTVTQISGLGASTKVIVSGKGYQPRGGVYLAQSVALDGVTFPSLFGNAAYVPAVSAEGTFSTELTLTETFAPSGKPVVDCRTTACFVSSFNSHPTAADPLWMSSRAQDVSQLLSFGPAKVTTQPASSSVRSGATAVFTAAANGADSVRWERSTDEGVTWAPVAGATSATLSVKSTVALNASRYRAVFSNAAGEVASSSAKLFVGAVPTRVASFKAAPDPVAKGSKLTLTGVFQTVGATDNTWRPVAKTALVIESRVKGTTTWKKATSATTAANGTFSATATATVDSDWRARYGGTADVKTSSSAVDAVDVRLKTAISGFNASPEPVRKGRSLTVVGTLRGLDGTWKNAASQSVTISFQANGSKTWTNLGTVRTNSKGVFTKAFTASKDGNWRAVFAANASYLGTTSASDHIDVR
ncbi:HtaA domain-containing protein [Streptomyces albipurpureus]|uniref:HtaA domain-containing protein n=1 Tax=Streptomyces albipurpureus TaxID=2897419 RepID=A0ABT0UU77_9ACTN|nr:HtaA domain-containing protein [Streptomyces sp. CWNU-1]MCM2392142.1 HtaA domain-containing protein [Streptomyces sp. CWNU-1]